jgi:hypothetical protein
MSLIHSQDPYHTYMGLAALAVYNVTKPEPGTEGDEAGAAIDKSWDLPPLHVAWNVTDDTAEWIRKHLSRTSA